MEAMAGDVVNLRTARKRKARSEKAAKAAENRIQFGRTKAEKQAAAAEKELQERRLDQSRLETDDGTSDR